MNQGICVFWKLDNGIFCPFNEDAIRILNESARVRKFGKQKCPRDNPALEYDARNAANSCT